MADPPLVAVTVSTRHPEKWELIDHETGQHWVIVDGTWRQIVGRRDRLGQREDSGMSDDPRVWSASTYQAPDGTQIRLVVPWEGNGSGRIPPPAILFYVGQEPWVFVYAGPVDGVVSDPALNANRR